MYTEEQRMKLYRILGDIHWSTPQITIWIWIKVFYLIRVKKSTLNSILCDTFEQLIASDTLLKSEFDHLLRLEELKALITTVKLENVPLYINTIPDVARWRLFIGV
jgi:hypothetical protein